MTRHFCRRANRKFIDLLPYDDLTSFKLEKTQTVLNAVDAQKVSFIVKPLPLKGVCQSLE